MSATHQTARAPRIDRPAKALLDGSGALGASSGRRRLRVTIISLFALAAIAALDNATGTELRIYPLYTVPIAFASWTGSARHGMLVATLSVLSWLASNVLAGLSLPVAIWVANTLAHAVAFGTVVTLVAYLQRARAAERRLARTDALTGLLNARAFQERAAAEIERQRRTLRSLALAFIDLDHFKEVNDRHGHKVGDEALATAARAIQSVTRQIDVLARVGGDEFALLLPETDFEGACEALGRCRTALRDAMAARGWTVTGSIGAVCARAAPAGVDALLSQADSLMYRVKQSTRDAVVVVQLDHAAPRPSPPPSPGP